MTLLERLRQYRKPKKEEPQAEQSETEESEGFDLTRIEEDTRQRIKAFLYEDRLVEELLPAFMALNDTEHADKLYELIEAKESELNTVLGNPEAFEQDTNPDDVKELPEREEETEETDYVMQILSDKYGE